MKKKIVCTLFVALSLGVLGGCIKESAPAESAAPESVSAQVQETSSVAGSYSRSYEEEMEGEMFERTETIVLNEDNSCEVTFQDTVGGSWSDDAITLDGGTVYEMKVTADEISLNIDGEWRTFKKDI